jgi:hypothetical protein
LEGYGALIQRERKEGGDTSSEGKCSNIPYFYRKAVEGLKQANEPESPKT